MKLKLAEPLLPRDLPVLGPSICTGSAECCGDYAGVLQTTSTVALWPVANKAILLPLTIPTAIIVTQFGWDNGTAVSGNVDAGILNLDGTVVGSVGGVAQAGVSLVQVADVTDFLVRAGTYFLALVLDNVTGRMNANIAGPSTQFMRALGLQEIAANYPLGSATALANPAAAYVPRMFVSFRSVV